MKRFLLFFCCLLFLLFLFSCFSKVDKNSHTLVIWHWMTDRQKTFEQLALKYEQQAGIKVRFELYAPSDVYSQKIIAAAQARVLPDVFGVLDEKVILASFIESGFIADLTEEFKKDNGAWEKSFFPKALAVNLFEEGNSYHIKPGIYGVPIDITSILMLYNKNLLQKAGISEPPRTFAEFLAAVKALKRVGIPALVSGWGEHWMVDCFASNYAFNIMGEEKIMATYRGEVPYTDPDWIAVFAVFDTLRKEGALAEGIVTKANKYAEQDFALERASFAFNGSWCVNVYADMNPRLQYGAILPPAVNDNLPLKIWGGAGSSFVVNNASKKKTLAIAFLKWLTAKEQQVFLSEETQNLPANRTAAAALSEILSEFAKAMDSATHPKVWPYNEDPLVIEVFDKGIQSIIIGEKTPRQVGADVQRAKIRQLERLQRRQKK
ncbi:MAG: extracellular solute-binding protein [Candidatus Omnitrophota bacterium]